MKPTESSEEGHGLSGEGGAPSGGVAAAPALAPDTRRSELGYERDAPVRSVSRVVPAPPPGAQLEAPHRTVEPGPARSSTDPRALSGRIRHAMDRTLPLGTPAPAPSVFTAARQHRELHTRTMLLGGRFLSELGADPEAPSRREPPPSQEPPPTPRTEPASTLRMPQGHAELLSSQPPATPPAPPVTPLAPPLSARDAAVQRFLSETPRPSSQAPREGALRASFVRPVGPPTAPPPRRRRTLPPADGAEGASSGEPPDAETAPAPSDADHVAFPLDRPRASALPPAPSAPARELTITAVSNGARSASMPFVRIPDARNPRSTTLSNSVILPPPPQPHDYEISAPAAAPSSPGRLALAATEKVEAGSPLAGPSHPAVSPLPPLASPPPAQPARPRLSLLDLPSAGGNPLDGYTRPRESLWQRFLIVFVVALAVVGLFALGAIAFGYLGKTNW